MSNSFDPHKNYEDSKKAIGYVSRKEAVQEDYDRLGFMSGLEVHQQLKTAKKLFCNCPSGIYQKSDDYDAEVIRHMRPTLSELGEYDGTALMEFKTRKNIVYRINNETACTYEVDDTPPFHINREALDIALRISILSKFNIVGEVHITRKQYLDGSIPTGFQRTAILGVEGEIQLQSKKVRLIQLSIEEDSCREISDVGHKRVYKTDRLGMPLIETVTYPEFVNPDEVKEGADYIRFLNRSTGQVETGQGATRADTNVSCRGGSRVEIKGVPSTKWMPDLTHNEVFRQWALLRIKELLNKKLSASTWKTNSIEIDTSKIRFSYEPLHQALEKKQQIMAVNLPGFKGILSHFTQPGKMFANEISDRLKVIACLEKPNMVHSEMFDNVITSEKFATIKELLKAGENDAQIILWGDAEDMPTALETIEERCKMAFEGVPLETRKSFSDGTTVFERVLPGADRMYPDTDSAPIPLTNEEIDELSKDLPLDIIKRYEQLRAWNAPLDTYEYLLKKNLMPLLERIIDELDVNPRWIITLFAHKLKHIENKLGRSEEFKYSMVLAMLRYLRAQKIDFSIVPKMLWEVYKHPKMDFESVLTSIKFRNVAPEEIESKIPFLKEKFEKTGISDNEGAAHRWIMGELSKISTGNMKPADLASKCK